MGMGNTDFVLPVGGFGGNGGFFGGGAGLAAFAGGALGSLLFNGGLGYGFGGGRGGCGGSYGGNGGPIIVNGGDSGHGRCSSAELDALTGLQASVNGVGLAVIEGQNASNLASCQGFSGVVNATNQGFAGLQNTITNGNAGIQQSLCQGFGGLNTAVLTSSKDAALLNCQSTSAITSAIDQCCCKTQTAIHAEGEATRALIQQNYISDLQTKLCDAKAENAALQSQAFVAASQQAQTVQFQQALDRQAVTLGALVATYRAGRIDERDSTATPAA